MILRVFLSSLLIASTPLVAMHDNEQERGSVLHIRPDPLALSAFKRESLVAQLARNLGYLYREEFGSNTERLLSFLKSPDFLDILWRDDEAREAYSRLSHQHPLGSEQVQREDEHSFCFYDLMKLLRMPGAKSPDDEDQVLSILSELNRIISNVTDIRKRRFSQLPTHFQERILSQALKVQGDIPTPEELAQNLAFLYKYEFKRHPKHLRSFLRSTQFVEFLKKNPFYRTAFDIISIQHSIYMEAHEDLRTISSREEYPLFLFLTEQFGKGLSTLQLTLKISIGKSLDL